MFDLPNATDADVREAIGPGFPIIRYIRSCASAHWSLAVSLRAGAWTPSAHRISANPRPSEYYSLSIICIRCFQISPHGRRLEGSKQVVQRRDRIGQRAPASRVEVHHSIANGLHNRTPFGSDDLLEQPEMLVYEIEGDEVANTFIKRGRALEIAEQESKLRSK
jgi:hypothetical protein